MFDRLQAYDRGNKFAGYQALASLREYVLISQEQVKVEHYVRQGAFWVYSAVTDLDATVQLDSVQCAFPLREIYNRTRFVADDAPPQSE